jgi:hypothetical protein
MQKLRITHTTKREGTATRGGKGGEAGQSTAMSSAYRRAVGTGVCVCAGTGAGGGWGKEVKSTVGQGGENSAAASADRAVEA